MDPIIGPTVAIAKETATTWTWVPWLLAIVVVLLAGVLIAIGIIWWRGRGDPELRELGRELKENERSAGQAAMRASKRTASASALGREVRHTHRTLAAEDREARHRRELDELSGGALPAGGPPAPPPHP